MDGSTDDRKEFQIDFFRLTRLLKDNIKILAALSAIIMTIAAMALFMTPNKYRSVASILPSGQTDKYAAIKEIAGVGSSVFNNDENSSLLFQPILQSRQVGEAVLNTEYQFMADGSEKKATLGDYFGDNNPEILLNRLVAITSISIDKKTGVISVSVETRYPQLSQAILQQTLEELDNFNMHKRRSSARENVRYLGKELAAKEKELVDAEDSLESYQMANRDWDNSADPEILKTLSRAKRDIEIKSKAYLFLREQYEIAKLEEQKDIPIVRILDSPSLPTLKSGPYRFRVILLSGLAAFILAYLSIIAFASIKRGKRDRTLIPTPVTRRNRIPLPHESKI